jgi:hypothetical protein
MFQIRKCTAISMRTPLFIVALSVLAIIFGSSCATATSAEPELVVIAPLGDDGLANDSGMTRQELEDHVRRFADRYITRMAIATNELSARTNSNEHKELMHEWKTVSNRAIVDMAIGQNAVTNLLDMMTMTRLSRLVVDDYWVPEVLGEELGANFLQTFVALEEDIWTVADDVLTSQHQVELKSLIDEWHAENPGQYYPWYIRLSNFSGQRAASLAAVQQSGGMLKEVARAREAAEEIQAFGERVLFYLQRAPSLTSNEFESGVADVLGGPEISKLMTDTDRFVTAVEQLIDAVGRLQGERIEVVDQFMDRVGVEREAMFQDLADSDPNIRSLLADLQPVLESLERTITVAKTKDPDSRLFDINEYKALVEQSAITALELRLLVESISGLLGESPDGGPVLVALLETENAVVDHFIRQSMILILVFFAGLLAYRFIAIRLLPQR